ncbi:MAG: hypothetical protein QOH35_6022, partial [Acidobacteriaceae bacterium]|nr:hypothetical protein [Acidobacteriaceae bacterium]
LKPRPMFHLELTIEKYARLKRSDELIVLSLM